MFNAWFSFLHVIDLISFHFFRDLLVFSSLFSIFEFRKFLFSTIEISNIESYKVFENRKFKKQQGILKLRSVVNITNNKEQETVLGKEKDDDYEFLIENDVRYSIIACLSIFQEPLNLSMMAKLTGHPITTIIHHIPQILERGLIKVEKIPGRRGKFYNITPKFIEKRNLRSKEIDEEFSSENLEKKKNLSKYEYKKNAFLETKKKFESKELSTNLIDVVKSLGVFNNNIAKISAEYLNYLVKIISQEFSDEMKVSLSEIIVNQSSVTLSNVSQAIELQKVYVDFLHNLNEIRIKFDQENKNVNAKNLEKVYFYFFTTPIIDITDDS